jgi:hypothetical protein
VKQRCSSQAFSASRLATWGMGCHSRCRASWTFFSTCTAPGSLDTGLHYAARLTVWSSHAARMSSGLRWPFFSINHSAL